MRLPVCLVITLLLTGSLFASERDNAVYIDFVDALSYPGFSFQGEYSGHPARFDFDVINCIFRSFKTKEQIIFDV